MYSYLSNCPKILVKRAAFLDRRRISWGKLFLRLENTPEVTAMHLKWIAALALTLPLGASAMAQEPASGSSSPQDSPVLKTRSKDAPSPGQPDYRPAPTAVAASPNAIPEGTRFIIKLKDTLDTKNLQPGKHF